MTTRTRSHSSKPLDERPVRVLLLRDHLIWAGGTIHFLDVLPRLDKSEIDITLAILNSSEAMTQPFLDRGVTPMFARGGASDPLGLRTALRLIGEVKPDLLLLSGPNAMLSGRIAGILRGVPSVVFLNNAIPEPAFRMAIQTRLAKATLGGLAVSAAIADRLAETYQLSRPSIEVIRGGRDLAPFLDLTGQTQFEAKVRTRADLGLSIDATVLLLSGRVMDAQKGHLGMLGAFRALIERFPDIRLLIAGDGPDIGACQNLIQDYGLADTVILAGRQEDMPSILAASDIAVVPSLVEEAFGFVAVEANASGLPVVAFDAGGLPEAICDGQTGMVVPKGDWTALTEALASLLSDPSRAKAMGTAGRAFSAQFDLDRYAQEFTDFHRTLASKRLAS